ncbi:MAG: hypothetical protein ISN28_15580, partial [Ectothiorhodospiraceae bacterium AqS1]|nr:hypothetical protein [Ectothiorhodospiraceae bacterium AqS1]
SIELSATTLSLTEGGSAGTFDVTLETPPAAGATATFSVTSGDSGAASVSPTTLTFDDSNYDTAQTVTVTPQDDSDGLDEDIDITISESSGYDADDMTVDVSVSDDDRSIIASRPSIVLDEGGSTDSFTVALETAPASGTSVSISVTSGDTGAVTVSPSTLTFDDSNYDTAKPVTLTPIEDDDANNESPTITLAVDGGGYIASNETVSVSVVDDESKSIRVSLLEIDLTEGGSDDSFTVKLSSDPVSSTDVSIVSADPDAVTVSPRTLTFTSANYETAQTVTVSPEDDDDPLAESVAITLSSTNSAYDADDVTVNISVAEDDAPPYGTIVLDGPDTLNLVEGGNAALFNVKIGGFVPKDWNVTVSVTNNDPGAILVSPTTLIFTPTNYEDSQTVRVVAQEDDDSIHESIPIVISATDGMSALKVGKQILVQDDDIPNETIILDSTDPLEIAAGGVGHFTVRLSGQPSENVTLALSASDDAITLDPTRLTFTPSDWIEAKRVKVSAGPLAGSGNEIYAITLSADGGIDTDDVQKTVRAIYTPPPDAKTIVVTLLPTDGERLRIDEDSSGRFTVGLEYHDEPPPTENVVVRLLHSNPDISLSPELLTFTPAPLANPSTAWAVWNETITVQVDARSDVDTQNDSDTISLTSDGFIERKLHIDIKDTTGNDWPMKAWALALPPPTVQDDATLRVHCKQDTPCYVYLDCGAQRDDSTYQGAIPDPIPARGSRVFTAQDIARHTGGLSWEGQGRLGCALRSPNAISAQVWTRSGDGVLVNNSAMIRSYPEGERHRADIESISSPDSPDKANIRIHCIAPVGDCTDTRLDCYDDYGTMYGVELGRIRRQIVHHLQSEELAMRILHRWNDLGLSCEVRSDNPFTVQVLSRTGGGGALVNNSASGN